MGHFAPHHYDLKPAGRCLVRSAQPADSERILIAAREVFATTQHVLTQPDEFNLTLSDELAFVESMLAAPDSVFLVALDATNPDGEVVGISSLKRSLPKRKMRHTLDLGMSVISSWRGRGVGTALMASCVQWARARPEIEIVTLAVYQDNAAGLALYRRFGFVPYGHLPRGLKHDDGSTWDQVLMYLDVRGPEGDRAQER